MRSSNVWPRCGSSGGNGTSSSLPLPLRGRPIRLFGDVDRRSGVGHGAAFVAQRLQRAVDGRHGQLGAGVEGAGALAGVPGPDEVELAHSDDPLDEPVRLGLDAALVRAIGFPFALLADQPGQDDCLPPPASGRFHGVEVASNLSCTNGSGKTLDRQRGVSLFTVSSDGGS